MSAKIILGCFGARDTMLLVAIMVLVSTILKTPAVSFSFVFFSSARFGCLLEGAEQKADDGKA